jgi:hypothetical protein
MQAVFDLVEVGIPELGPFGHKLRLRLVTHKTAAPAHDFDFGRRFEIGEF